MTPAELYVLLETTGLEAVYNNFKSPPSLPYVVYKESGASAWGSDEKNGIRKTEWLVELYTVEKDIGTQSKLEVLFDDLGLNWVMSFDDLIESEGLYLTAYTFETTAKIRRVNPCLKK